MKGGDGDLTSLDSSGVLLEKGEATSLHVGVGSTVHLLSNSRKRATVTVRGIYKDDTLMTGGILTSSPGPAPDPDERRGSRARDAEAGQQRRGRREARRR